MIWSRNQKNKIKNEQKKTGDWKEKLIVRTMVKLKERRLVMGQIFY